MNSVRVNGRAFRARLTESGMSERELTRRSGLGSIAVRSILFRNSLARAMSIADVQRCLVAVGMTWGDLFDIDNSPEHPAPNDDAAMLASLLIAANRATSPDLLARALDWPLTRVHEAASALDDRLSPLGLRVHRASNGLRVRPLDLRSAEALRRLEDLRDDEEGINAGMARVLHKVMSGRLSRQEAKNNDLVQIGALLNRSAVEVSEEKNERYVLTPEVKYAFDF